MKKITNFTVESTNNLIMFAYAENDSEIYWNIIAELHHRGSQQEFDIAKSLALSHDPVHREIAADILGQLAFSKNEFDYQSVEILINLLNDNNEDVIASAAFSLGHRNDTRAVPSLINLLKHPNPRVRHGVACGLSCLENINAIKGLIFLTHDKNEDVRNWATFGLGDQCEMDLPEIREALYQRLTDEISEIRGEAFIGLANRKDFSIVNLLIQELEGDFNGSWAIRASKLLADSRLCLPLKALRNNIDITSDEYFLSELDEAILNCCETCLL